MRGHKPERMSLRDEAPKHATVHQTPQMWRAPEGLAAVPVGGGGAWPGFESTRRAEGSRRGRLVGGPPPTSTPSSPAPQQDPTAPGTPVGPTATPGFRPNAPRAASPGGRPRGRSRRYVPAAPVGSHGDGAIQAERPASSVARWTPPRPASWAAWVRQEKPSARYTASGCADRDGSSEWDATATDRS